MNNFRFMTRINFYTLLCTHSCTSEPKQMTNSLSELSMQFLVPVVKSSSLSWLQVLKYTEYNRYQIVTLVIVKLQRSDFILMGTWKYNDSLIRKLVSKTHTIVSDIVHSCFSYPLKSFIRKFVSITHLITD